MSGNARFHFYVADKECLRAVPVLKKNNSLLTVLMLSKNASVPEARVSRSSEIKTSGDA